MLAVELAASPAARLAATVDLLERRGYAVTAARLGQLCVGGPLPPGRVRQVLPAAGLLEREGLVVSAGGAARVGTIAARQAEHARLAPVYQEAARGFARRLGELPFVIAVSIAGSLASGGFQESDDVDLDLVVEDGYRHTAYVALNLIALGDAWRRRGKPVDVHTARPLVPRVMTANLILERGQCFPLSRTDPAMAYQLLASEPVVGGPFLAQLIEANPELTEHFPQLAALGEGVPPARRCLPARLFPRRLDGPARLLGKAAWRYMQWTRRRRPDALARVRYVRATMAPYHLFPELEP